MWQSLLTGLSLSHSPRQPHQDSAKHVNEWMEIIYVAAWHDIRDDERYGHKHETFFLPPISTRSVNQA